MTENTPKPNNTPETPAPAKPAPVEKPKEAAKPQPTTPAKEEKPKAEKQTNCLACNKPIRKIKRYYRDGKFYCSKQCWRNFVDKAKAEAEKQNEEQAS